ncbi:myosin-5-like isoform X2 [Hordeum vulgare subsp. vulgare]|uniref:myosin-5-like isoform X2 n=1 Tax=Hordeum vulgare subsp. vulgare TaxID=112509 RepID=UPI001D1A5798|nr:myosin-5-like isoform X2 [Hordeum vulgare subsp. vulgare]
MAATLNIVVGSHVWLEDKDLAWIDGEVFRIEGRNAHVRTTNGKTVTASISNIHPKDTEILSDGIDDMTRLSYLHEPGVLDNLAVRYAKNIIYTYTGNILIAINPFQRLPHIAEPNTMEKYKGANFGELDPHVFAIADVSYRQMMNEGKSNSILVSGESGAGKTETTKLLMRYLAFLGGRSKTGGRTVEQQVLESNPVLEAFGNAKTVRNNNSSRFGKFVEIQFDQSGKISGAAIRTYLLERSRVCQINSPERNYHCFYFLCSAPSEDIKRYKLDDPSSFHYLNQSSCIKVDGISDAEEYVATRSAMNTVGITEQEQEATFRVVAAVLHLGNINFVKGRDVDSSVVKDEKARFHLNAAAELLMCDREKLENALIKRKINTPEGVITTTVDHNSATVSRDGLAKQIYCRLFDWLVNRLNASIGQDAHSARLIGVLDIYGFESFKTNSFEQLCINFTNEKLQQHFNQNVFKMEQEEYNRENIDWSYIEFVDNQDVLDLIERKPGGIIALLDEACMFPKCTHESFSQKLYEKFKNNKRFSKPKLSRTAFTIQHYAGEVIYQSDHFLDKNRDYVVLEHEELLNASKCSFVSGLFPPVPEENTKSSKSSIANRFKGVLEAIRISCAGYPTRKLFRDFLQRFRILAPEILKERNDEKVICQKILDKTGLQGYQIGRTKVFLRAGQMAELDARRTEVRSKAASVIQSRYHTHVARQRFLAIRNTSVSFQSIVRVILACKRRVFLRKQDAALRIQKTVRCYLALKSYCKLRCSAITLQAGLRAFGAYNEYVLRKQKKASIHIQARWRCHRDNSNYLKLKRSVLIYQCAWRRRVARRELRKLKMAARDTEALKVEKEKLEEHVEELTSRLGLEMKLRADLENNKAGEISKLQAALHEMEHRVEEATAMQESESAKRAVEEALAQEREKIAILTNEVEGMKVLLSREQEENTATKNDLAIAQERCEDLNGKIEVADENIKQLRDTVKRFEENVTELESSLMTEKQQNETTRREIGEAHQRIEELLIQVADANGRSDILQSTVQRLEESLTEREGTLLLERQESEAIKKSLAEAREENEELAHKTEVAEKDSARFQSNIERLEEAARTFETSLLAEKQHGAAIMSQLAETKEEIEELQKKFTDANRTNDMLQDSLKRLEETAATRDALYVAEKQEHGQTKEALSKSQESNSELLKKVDESEKNINKLMENVKRLEKHATSRESLLLKTKQNQDCTTKALAEAEKRSRELTKSCEDSENKISLLEDSVNRLEECIAEKDSLLATERQENNATKDELASAQKKTKELVNELQHCQEISKRLEQDATAKDALLISEKQTHEATKKTLTETLGRNEELIKKIQDSDKHSLQLQLTVERLQENASAKEALLLREREQNNATMKVQEESQEKNLQLLKKFEDVDKKIDLLQGTIQRLGDHTEKDTLLLSERQEKDELKKALTETEYKNEDLMIKIGETNKKIEHLQNTIHMLEQDIAAKVASLGAEKQENDAIRKSLVEAQESNDELFKKVRDSEYKAHQLQDTVQKLQVDAISRLSSFVLEKQESDAVKKALTEARGRNEDLIRRNEDLLDRNDDLIKKIEELQETVQRLEGKSSNLEAENQTLRQQSIVSTPSTAKSQASYSKISMIHRNPENGLILNGNVPYAEIRPSFGPAETRHYMGSAPDLTIHRDYDTGEKMQRVLLSEAYQHQQPQDDQKLLLKYITQHLGFSGNKPVAALLIYQYLLQSRSFEVAKTGVFDSILQAINSATEAQHDTRSLAYWLSNLSTLSVLLQRSFRTTRTATSIPSRRKMSYERIYQASQASNSGLAYFSGQLLDEPGAAHQVDPKYPALLFKQQLVDLIEKVYGLISDKLKKELNPLLELCIQDPRTSQAKASVASAGGLGQHNQLTHWLGIVKILSNYLYLLIANYVPTILVHKLLTQMFSMVNVQLFNRLLLRRECCSFSNGEHIRAGLAQLKHWCNDFAQELADSAWEALRHIRQAADFLVISRKQMRTWREIRNDICPALSLQQLERIVGMYWDDMNGTNVLSAEFASSMRATMHEESNSLSSFSVLLDDDSSIPFSLDDIAKSMPNIEDTVESDLMPFIRENQSLALILQRRD